MDRERNKRREMNQGEGSIQTETLNERGRERKQKDARREKKSIRKGQRKAKIGKI